MGLISRVLSIFRNVRRGAHVSEVKGDMGGGYNLTMDQYADAGDDSHPLPDDYAATGSNIRYGGRNVVGFLDPKNEKISKVGEKRTYSRDAEGNIVAQVHLKNDGEITMFNDIGSITIKPDGQIVSKNANCSITQEPDGQIVSTNAIASMTLNPDGLVVTENDLSTVTQKNDGEINLANAATNIDMFPAGAINLSNAAGGAIQFNASTGTIVINGVSFDTSGNVVIPDPGDLTVGTKNLREHVHDGVTSGIEDTGPNQ